MLTEMKNELSHKPERCAMENERLKCAYEYFSHNIRTATSTIVAILEAIKSGLVEDDEMQDMMDMVVESGFFLDMFDSGMETCFRFLVDSTAPVSSELIDINKLVPHFMERVPKLMEERGTTVVQNITSSIRTDGSAHTIKVLLEIILYEAVKSSGETLTVSSEDRTLTVVSSEPFVEIPEVFSILKDILSRCGVSFDWTEESFVLGF